MTKYRRKRIKYKAIIISLIGIIVLITGISFTMTLFEQPKKNKIQLDESVVGKYNITDENQVIFEDESLTKLFNDKLVKPIESYIEEGNTLNCNVTKYFDNFLQFKCDIQKTENAQSYSLIYNQLTKKELIFEDIFRDNQIRLNRLFPNLSQQDKTKITLNDKSIIVGEVEINTEKYPFLFKSGNGINSLYKKDKITPKQFTYDNTKKKIAFTYDDGPRNNNHDRIRELFNEYNIPATFYVIGEVVEQHPEKVVKTYQDGHTIANHTYTHPGLLNKNLTTIPVEKAIEELEKTDDIIFQTIGVDPTTMRPPGGFIDDKVKELTPHKSVLWTVDSQDWMYKHNSEKVYQNVRQNIKENSIVLFHDLYDSSYEASKRIIPELIAEGYQFVDIDTLLKEIDN